MKCTVKFTATNQTFFGSSGLPKSRHRVAFTFSSLFQLLKVFCASFGDVAMANSVHWRKYIEWTSGENRWLIIEQMTTRRGGHRGCRNAKFNPFALIVDYVIIRACHRRWEIVYWAILEAGFYARERGNKLIWSDSKFVYRQQLLFAG